MLRCLRAYVLELYYLVSISGTSNIHDLGKLPNLFKPQLPLEENSCNN